MRLSVLSNSVSQFRFGSFVFTHGYLVPRGGFEPPLSVSQTDVLATYTIWDWWPEVGLAPPPSVSQTDVLFLYTIAGHGGRYRIRTRVFGLEGRSDIQTTLIAH